MTRDREPSSRVRTNLHTSRTRRGRALAVLAGRHAPDPRSADVRAVRAWTGWRARTNTHRSRSPNPPPKVLTNVLVTRAELRTVERQTGGKGDDLGSSPYSPSSSPDSKGEAMNCLVCATCGDPQPRRRCLRHAGRYRFHQRPQVGPRKSRYGDHAYPRPAVGLAGPEPRSRPPPVPTWLKRITGRDACVTNPTRLLGEVLDLAQPVHRDRATGQPATPRQRCAVRGGSSSPRSRSPEFGAHEREASPCSPPPTRSCATWSTRT